MKYFSTLALLIAVVAVSIGGGIVSAQENVPLNVFANSDTSVYVNWKDTTNTSSPTFTVQRMRVTPDADSSLTANVGGTSVSLSWTNSTTNVPYEETLERSTDNVNWTSLSLANSVVTPIPNSSGSKAWGYTDTISASGAHLYYRSRACASGVSLTYQTSGKQLNSQNRPSSVCSAYKYAEVNTLPPFTIDSISPSNGDQDVAGNATVVVVFSEDIDPASVNNTTFNVKQGSSLVNGSTNVSGPRITFSPSGGFSLGKVAYSINISSSIKSLRNTYVNLQQAVFTTADYSAPTATFRVSAATVEYPNNVSLTWSSSNATQCSVDQSGYVWSQNSIGTSGSQTVVFPAVTDSTSFVLGMTCVNGPKAVSVSATVVVNPPAPLSVSVSANPQSVTVANPSTSITWTSANAKSCSSSWASSVPVSGSKSFTPTTQTQYTVTCANDFEAKSASVTVGTIPLPTVSLYTSQSSIVPPTNSTVTLSWSSANATSCAVDTSAGNYGWYTGTIQRSGSQSVTFSQVSSQAIYKLGIVCSSAGGTAKDSVTVTVNPPATPSVSLTVNPDALTLDYVLGTATTNITWNTQNVTSCSASGWTLPTGMQSGTVTKSFTSANVGTNTFSLTCTGPGGTRTATANVAVSMPAKPSVNISASPTSIYLNDSTMLQWNSTNAVSCAISGDWSSTSAGTSGSTYFTPTSVGPKSFAITCKNIAGETSASANVAVNTVSYSGTISAPSSVRASKTPIGYIWSYSYDPITVSWTSNAASPIIQTCSSDIFGYGCFNALTSLPSSGSGTLTYALPIMWGGLHPFDVKLIAYGGLMNQTQYDLAQATVNVTEAAAQPAPTITITSTYTTYYFWVDCYYNQSIGECDRVWGSGIDGYQDSISYVSGFSWTTTNATSCTASGDWSGSQPTSGSYSNISGTNYSLTCSGPGGTASSQATVVRTNSSSELAEQPRVHKHEVEPSLFASLQAIVTSLYDVLFGNSVPAQGATLAYEGYFTDVSTNQSAVSLSDGGLTPGSVYLYRVRASSQTGWSTPVAVKTLQSGASRSGTAPVCTRNSYCDFNVAGYIDSASASSEKQCAQNADCVNVGKQSGGSTER